MIPHLSSLWGKCKYDAFPGASYQPQDTFTQAWTKSHWRKDGGKRKRKRKKRIGNNSELGDTWKWMSRIHNALALIGSLKRQACRRVPVISVFHPTYFHGKIPKECVRRGNVGVRQAQEKNWTAKIKQNKLLRCYSTVFLFSLRAEMLKISC